MFDFYQWAGSPPKRCGVCRKGLKRTLVFSDTKDGQRNVAMCEECFRRVGEERASYGMARRYARIRGMWISGSRPDWKLDEIPDGATISVTDALTGRTVSFRYDKSLVR